MSNQLFLDEHNRFLEAIDKYGRDWKKVQQYVGTRSSTQSRSHAQKFFKKINLTEVKPGLGLTKHKSLDVTSRCLKKLKVIEEENSDDEEIIIWIDKANTDHPRLRNPTPSSSEKTKPGVSALKPQADEAKEQAKFENELTLAPEAEDKKEIKANSEKLIKQPELLPSSVKISETEKKTLPDEVLIKDGKSFDNTNASVQDNDLDKNILCVKEPVKIASCEEPVCTEKLQLGALEEDVLYKEGLEFGDDNFSWNSENFIRNEEKNHETNDIRALGLWDDNFGNNELEMGFSDKIQDLDNMKAPEMNDFEDEYDMKPFGDNVEEFSHHSNLQNNELMEPPAAELNYF